MRSLHHAPSEWRGIFYLPLRRLRQMAISCCCVFQCYGPNFGTKVVLDRIEADLLCFLCMSCRTCRDDPWLVPLFCHTRPYRELCNSSWDANMAFFQLPHISCSFLWSNTESPTRHIPSRMVLWRTTWPAKASRRHVHQLPQLSVFAHMSNVGDGILSSPERKP